MRKLYMVVNEDRFFLSHRKEIALAAQQDGWHIAPDNREGIRVSFDKDDGDGWFLLRLSVHDPILPLNIESDSVGGVEIIKEKVLAFLRTQDGVAV